MFDTASGGTAVVVPVRSIDVLVEIVTMTVTLAVASG